MEQNENLENVNLESDTQTQANDYELQGTEEIIKGIPSLNYLKLTNLKNDMEKQLEMLESSKTLIDSLEAMSTTDELGKKVALANILGDKEYKNDTKIFLDTFEGNKNKITSIIEAIDEELKKYNDIQKGTKFYNELYISNLKETIATLGNTNKNIEPFLFALDAFNNRTSVDFIMNYSKSYVICDIKAEVIKNPQKCIRKYLEEFSHFFSEAQIETFIKYITEKFEDNQRAIKTFLSHLGKIIRKEKQTGKYNYVKVFIMNVDDIVKGKYDLDGGKEYFDSKILELYEKYK